ncbi:hypothetical protein IMSHALPRED_008912 [Imshaugia aleurites]|uniref:Uncharacterized protein n=1 Tax=Imshaugia aleurites TaxID=172621 RepID=A0A8H3G3Q9_9LECA|nr:hypothetical protein IMSHALPRED_008912 [Imshaugia aleurites]
MSQQKAVREVGISNGRDPQFASAEERMIIDERSGSDKLSTAFPDKNDWDQVDHCVYALFHICAANTKSASGLFSIEG